MTTFGIVNCFLVQEEDGFTLVDTGLRGTADSIMRVAKRLGGVIQRIVLTHAHVDHIGSVDALMAELPNPTLAIGRREGRLLRRDLTLDVGESGKALFGFPGTSTPPSQLLEDGDRVGSLLVVNCPGHTPGHIAFLDLRDHSLLAGDAFTTQRGLVAAGVFRPFFPFPALFSWNAGLAAQSGQRLRELNPSLLAVGHGNSLFSPGVEMDRALAEANRQRRPGRQP